MIFSSGSFSRSKPIPAVVFVLALAVISGSFLLDAPIQSRVLEANQGHWSHDRLVAAASRYGDWPELMLAGVLGLIVARRFRSVRWQRILLSAMIASTLSGMTANLSRLTTGRTRPRAAAEQGWYGPRHDGKWLIGDADFNSFPSGHTATAVGFAGVILFAAPAWGIPAMAVAIAVALSRILLGAHHPSDVVTAAVISVAMAWLVWEFFEHRIPLQTFLERPDLRHWFNVWRLFTRRTRYKSFNQSSVHVIIYDDFHHHFTDWLVAVGPAAPVWNFIKHVDEVVVVNSFKKVPLPESSQCDAKIVIIPMRENQISNVPKGYCSLVPEIHALEIFSCKASFSYYLREQGLSHLQPKEYSTPEEAEYPCILKQTNLYGGSGIVLADSQEDLKLLLEKEPWRERNYIIQAYVPGLVEYTTHMVCQRGRILWHCTYFIILSREGIMRPWSPISYSTQASILQLSQMEAILAPLQFSGPCNIDYKTDVDGNIIAFEINPRLGGGIMRPEKIVDLHDALSCIIDAALSATPNP